MDLENIIDWHLFLLFSNGGDGVIKNYYLYKSDSYSPFRIALWDCDHSFGRDGDGELNMLESFPNFQRHILLNRLMRVEKIEYENRLKSRWSELRKNGVFSEENLNHRIESMRSVLEPNIKKNIDKWPLKSEFYQDDSTFKEEVDLIKKFIKLNLKRLDEKFERN